MNERISSFLWQVNKHHKVTLCKILFLKATISRLLLRWYKNINYATFTKSNNIVMCSARVRHWTKHPGSYPQKLPCCGADIFLDDGA